MIDTPEVMETGAQRTAVVRLSVAREEIRNVMGPAMSEVIQGIAAQGISPAGPLFSHHFRMDPDVFDFEVGVPVHDEVTPTGRMVQSELPAGRVVQTTYHGGYEGLGDAWGAFDAWIAENGLAIAGDLWERYVAGPESSSDPAEWKTELVRPLA